MTSDQRKTRQRSPRSDSLPNALRRDLLRSSKDTAEREATALDSRAVSLTVQ
ncbi:hypothetical protein PYCC9005_004646 [Savitreella phatthalungensis]